jgi:uncharacterized protein GlcG (DUF336 family)
VARVTRTEVDLALAQAMVAAAVDSAAAQGALVSAAVVDAGGHLVAFARMDGAEIAGPTLATDKAYTAVAHRIGTHELAELVAPGGALVGMNSAGGGRYVCFGGGLPLWSGGRVVGAVGVSGGTADEDQAAAAAGAAVFDAQEATAR